MEQAKTRAEALAKSGLSRAQSHAKRPVPVHTKPLVTKAKETKARAKAKTKARAKTKTKTKTETSRRRPPARAAKAAANDKLEAQQQQQQNDVNEECEGLIEEEALEEELEAVVAMTTDIIDEPQDAPPLPAAREGSEPLRRPLTRSMSQDLPPLVDNGPVVGPFLGEDPEDGLVRMHSLMLVSYSPLVPSCDTQK